MIRNAILFGCVIALLATPSFTQGEENWARFRGPNGQAHSAATTLPTQWNADTNIAWKTAIPGIGWSSPIVWNDHIFLTTATDDGKQCRVLALDRKTGNILWDRMVFTQEPGHRHPRNSYATPTPATDGETVFAAFWSGGIAALDFEGNLLWKNLDLEFYSQHGMATSPILYGDMLILAVDQSSREEPKAQGWHTPWDGGYVLALDKKTGEQRWKTPRGMSRLGHSTPTIVNVNGKDILVSPAGNVVQGFDPTTGELIWTVKSEGEPCVQSPVIGENMVFTAPDWKTIRAIRPDGQGDATETHIAWEHEGRGSTMIASFLYVKPCLYTNSGEGFFSCLDANTGTLLWQLRLGEPMDTSPIYADGKIYALSNEGTTTILKPAADPTQPAEIIAKNELGEFTQASIVVMGNQLLIRTSSYLWCIGK